MQEPIFIGAQIYRGSVYGSQHPISIPRVSAATDLARALQILPDRRYKSSPRAKPAALTGFHTPDYVQALQQAETRQEVSDATRQRYQLGTASNPLFPEMYRRPATGVGGGMLAAELVRHGGAVFNPGGGTHHGMPDRASGFCFLNEPVLTIHRLLAMGLSRVAYVDIDAHHGDGVEAAFEGSDSVRVISIHEERRWPFTGKLTDRAGGAAFNLPLPRGFHDDEFAFVLDALILPLVEDFQPDAVFLQCGTDAVTEDPLSRLCLSNNAHRLAIRALRATSPRLIVSGGGGYNPWTVSRCWAGVWAELSGAEIPDALPDAARRVLSDLRWSRKAAPRPELLSSIRDPWRGGPIRDTLRDDVSTLLRPVSSPRTQH